MTNIVIAIVLALNVIFPCGAMEQNENTCLARRTVSEGNLTHDVTPVVIASEKEVEEFLTFLIDQGQIRPLPFHSSNEAKVSVVASLRKKDEKRVYGPKTFKKTLSAEALLQHIKEGATYFEVCAQDTRRKTSSLDNAHLNSLQNQKSSLCVISEEKSQEKDEKIENEKENRRWLEASKRDNHLNDANSEDDNGIFFMDEEL